MATVVTQDNTGDPAQKDAEGEARIAADKAANLAAAEAKVERQRAHLKAAEAELAALKKEK